MYLRRLLKGWAGWPLATHRAKRWSDGGCLRKGLDLQEVTEVNRDLGNYEISIDDLIRIWFFNRKFNDIGLFHFSD